MNIESYVANDSQGVPCLYCHNCHSRSTEVVIGLRSHSIWAVCIPCLRKHITNITICYMALGNFKALINRLNLT